MKLPRLIGHPFCANRDLPIAFATQALWVSCLILSGVLLCSDRIAKTEEVAGVPKEAVKKPGTTVNRLVWHSGGMLPGRLIKADEQTLHWRADGLFGETLKLQRDFLQSINFATANQNSKTTEPFAIETIDGQTVYGRVVKLDDESLTLNSDRTGEVQIDRSQIATILNLSNADNIVSGEIDFDQWQADRGLKKYWKIDEQGYLQSKRSDTHLYHKQKLPNSVFIELELSWQKTLDFSLGFGVPSKKRELESVPRLESWEDTLVLIYGDEFEPVIEEIDNELKKLRLLIHWDRVGRRIVIHNALGKVLASAKLEKPQPTVSSGLILTNKMGDLTVEHISVRDLVLGFISSQPSIQVKDKPAINAQVKSFNGKTWLITRDDQAESETEPESNAKSLLASTEGQIETSAFYGAFLVNQPQPRVTDADQIRFIDGMLLTGNVIELTDNAAVLKTSLSDTPIRVKLAGTRRLEFFSDQQLDLAKTADEFKHRLVTPVGEIMGRLEDTQTTGERGILMWCVPGAENQVSIQGGDAKIILKPKRQPQAKDNPWGDTLYLHNRDVVPCRVAAISPDAIQIESFIDKKTIPQHFVKAIDLENSFADNSVPLDAPNWIIPPDQKRRLRVKDGVIELKERGRFGHPLLLSAGTLSFDLKWRGNYGLLECNVLSSGSGAMDSGQKIYFAIYGNFISATGSNPTNIHNNPNAIPAKNNTAKIKLQYVNGRIRVTINGKKALSKLIDSHHNNGRGLSFTAKKLYDPNVRFSLKNFVVGANSNRLSYRADPERRSLLLTLPRLKKLNPPKQILCAHNGDLLRGEVLEMRETHLKFRANQEDLRFARSVVGSIVWLTSNDAQEPATPTETEKSPVQILMNGDQRIAINLEAWDNGALVGKSEVLGACRLPLDQIYELRMGSFAYAAKDAPYSDWVIRMAPEPKMDSVARGDQDGRLFGGDSPLIGTTPKSFQVPLLNGETFTLSQQRGKVVVLDFWATWCGPCVRALPELIEVVESYSTDDVALLALNQQEGDETIKTFLKRRELELSVGKDKGQVANQFSMEALPLTILIDRSGKVAFVKVGSGGSKYKQQLKSAIDELLNKTADPQE